jgi:hypothetical protein
MNDKRKIKINQILYGYDKGHCQLATSLSKQIPKLTHSLLLRLSDASISGYGSESPSYITGYPLPEIGAYSLSRTWPAPEMHRPGCVWTQTLIIDYADLARIRSLAILDSLFQKPSNDMEFSKYKKSIALDPYKIPLKETYIDNLMVHKIVSDLYDKVTLPLSISWEESLEYTLYSVWSQQWPRLRRAFKFRTYASKTGSSEEFDFIGSNRTEKILEVSQDNLMPYEDEWIEQSVNNIVQDNSNDLQDFMWRFGADSTSTLKSYKPLVKIWSSVKNGNNVENLNNAWNVANFWSHPSPSLVVELLKLSLALPKSSITVELRKNIFSILKNQSLTIFNSDELDAIASQLDNLDLEELYEYINSNIEKDHENTAVIIDILSTSKLVELVNYQNSLLDLVLDIRPLIYCEVLFWKNRRHLSKKLILMLKDNLSSIEAILSSVFEAKAYDAFSEIIELSPDKIIPILINLCNSSDTATFDYKPWVKIIANHPQVTLMTLSSNITLKIDFIELLTNHIDVNTPNPLKEKDSWLVAIKRSKRKLTIKNQTLALYILERGLLNVKPEAHSLIIKSFDISYKAVKSKKITWSDWSRLEKNFNTNMFSYLFETDRCEALSQGVAEIYLRNKFPAEYFISLTSNENALKQMIKYLMKSSRGKLFIQNVLTATDWDNKASLAKLPIIDDAISN